MAKKQEPKPPLYGTKQVAEILGIPEWRVKNFSEGDAYGLPPSQSVGSGRGSRRLYDANSVYRLAIANELVNCGFAPESVGRAIREIAESKLSLRPGDTRRPGEAKDEPEWELPILTCWRGRWNVQKQGEIPDESNESIYQLLATEGGHFYLNFPVLLKGVSEKMEAVTAPHAKQDRTKAGNH
jgi:hypothetical protein